ncbi:hypothetical protein GDO86_011016 [Hymenochirus boettgeri]|uniref:Uncharacterized protein n=1 Tax=Hymenochirus boettgeri TaxID=247094 RepID=A0A8T2JFI2_9PIPI|nr:hypothetical protein GDO86_011016 [Hymenochirus boettgeri]
MPLGRRSRSPVICYCSAPLAHYTHSDPGFTHPQRLRTTHRSLLASHSMRMPYVDHDPPPPPFHPVTNTSHHTTDPPHTTSHDSDATYAPPGPLPPSLGLPQFGVQTFPRISPPHHTSLRRYALLSLLPNSRLGLLPSPDSHENNHHLSLFLHPHRLPDTFLFPSLHFLRLKRVPTSTTVDGPAPDMGGQQPSATRWRAHGTHSHHTPHTTEASPPASAVIFNGPPPPLHTPLTPPLSPHPLTVPRATPHPDLRTPPPPGYTFRNPSHLNRGVLPLGFPPLRLYLPPPPTAPAGPLLSLRDVGLPALRAPRQGRRAKTAAPQASQGLSLAAPPSTPCPRRTGRGMHRQDPPPPPNPTTPPPRHRQLTLISSAPWPHDPNHPPPRPHPQPPPTQPTNPTSQQFVTYPRPGPSNSVTPHLPGHPKDLYTACLSHPPPCLAVPTPSQEFLTPNQCRLL